MSLNVYTRLNELKTLKDGWLDGAGQALDSNLLDRLGDLFTRNYPDTLPFPYIYPTESGGVQFEWCLFSEEDYFEVKRTIEAGDIVYARNSGDDAELEINLETLQGRWVLCYELEGVEEVMIDLSTDQGWTDLANRVRTFAQ